MNRNLLQEIAYNMTANISTGPAIDPKEAIAHMKRLVDAMPPRRPDPFALESLFDVKISIEPPPRPKMQISSRLAELMPREWVAEQNRWLAEFFGYEDPLTKDGQVLFMGEHYWHMNPVTHSRMADILKVSAV